MSAVAAMFDRMTKRAIAAAVGLALGLATAHAAQAPVPQPTIGPHSMTDLNTNFLNPALQSLMGMNSGPGAPSNGPGSAPLAYQFWADTLSTTPATIYLYDGAQFVAIGALNSSTHLWSLPSPTLTGDIILSPAFTSANPGNAGIYGQIANPANGYSTIFNAAQVSLGAAIPASGQFGQNAVGIQQAFVATLSIAASDAAGNAGLALSGYGVTNSALTGVVGLFGFGGTAIAGSSQWASNYLVSNCANQGCTVGFNNTVSYGSEYNFSIMGPATNSPTRGLYAIGNSTITQANANASGVFAFIDIDSPGITQTPHLQWLTAIKTENGSASIGLLLGAQGTASNSGSQSLVLQSVNSIGGNAQAILQTDPGGDLLLTPTANGAVALQDGNGGTNLETGVGFGSSDVALTKLAVAGALCNSASGVISTTTGKCSGDDPSDVTSVSNSDSTLTISPTIGPVVASLNLAHANSWSAAQAFSAGLSGTLTGHASLDAALTGATFSGAVSGITTLGATGVASFTNATAATSAATGALVLSGGLGVAGAGWFGTYVNTQGVAIGSLPACGAGIEGARMYVTNGATSPAFGASVSATGAVVAPVFCNGAGWVYGELEPANDNGPLAIAA